LVFLLADWCFFMSMGVWGSIGVLLVELLCCVLVSRCSFGVAQVSRDLMLVHGCFFVYRCCAWTFGVFFVCRLVRCWLIWCFFVRFLCFLFLFVSFRFSLFFFCWSPVFFLLVYW